MTIRLAIAFTILAALIVVAAVGTLMNRPTRRANAKPRTRYAIGGPMYPDGAAVRASLALPVLDAHEVRVDELGEWEPTRHALAQPVIADRLLLERQWMHLLPPSWSAWTGVHPVVRLADVEAARLAMSAV